jgi:arginine metabolism regulation protein II
LPADPHQKVLQSVEIDDILQSIDAFEVYYSCRTGGDPLVIHNFGVFDSLAAGSDATPCSTEGSADSPDSPPCYVTGTLPSVSPTYHEYASSFVGVSSCEDISLLSNIAQPFLSVHDGTSNPHHQQHNVSGLSSLTENVELWQNPKSITVQVPSDEYSSRDEKRLYVLPKHYQWQGANGAIVRNPSPTYLSGLEQFLMYHYVHRVVHLFCVIDNDKSPWKTIHLPRALQSVGQLNVEGSSTRVQDALRNALLSISAFYLANDSRSRMCLDEGARWTSEATLFRGRAIKLLKDAVNNDFQGSPPKYKEFLATMLSMISINVSKSTATVVIQTRSSFGPDE